MTDNNNPHFVTSQNFHGDNEYIEWLRENVKPPEEGSTEDVFADQKKQNGDEEDEQEDDAEGFGHPVVEWIVLCF